MAGNATDWVARFAAELGIAPPTEEELNLLLGLASVAAHASERAAAPISCWLAARAGAEPRDALAAAKRVGRDIDAEGS
jgi:hypothetical protein